MIARRPGQVIVMSKQLYEQTVADERVFQDVMSGRRPWPPEPKEPPPEFVVETRFLREAVPDEMPSEADLVSIGRRLMQRAIKAKALA